VVYRALAGLDSLAQSAGRCDREGKLSEACGRPAGEFIVFRAATLPPPGTLCKAMQATEKLFALAPGSPELRGGLDPFNPQHGELYFRELYSNENLDAANIQRELESLNFANVAERFRLMDNSGASVAVPWGNGAKRIARFRRTPTRENLRALQPYLVQVRRPFFQQLQAMGVIELSHDSLGLPTSLFGDRYDDAFGLSPEVGQVHAPDLLMA
jgi:CRISPR-associated endonuclease/helicase Cas3